MVDETLKVPVRTEVTDLIRTEDKQIVEKITLHIGKYYFKNHPNHVLWSTLEGN